MLRVCWNVSVLLNDYTIANEGNRCFSRFLSSWGKHLTHCSSYLMMEVANDIDCIPVKCETYFLSDCNLIGIHTNKFHMRLLASHSSWFKKNIRYSSQNVSVGWGNNTPRTWHNLGVLIQGEGRVVGQGLHIGDTQHTTIKESSHRLECSFTLKNPHYWIQARFTIRLRLCWNHSVPPCSAQPYNLIEEKNRMWWSVNISCSENVALQGKK